MKPKSNTWSKDSRVTHKFSLIPIAREKEYLSLLHLQQAANANKEKEVQALHAKLKTLRTKIEHAKERNKQIQY
jgi:hypothetical protein